MRRWMLSVVALFTGCAGLDHCDYDLKAESWRPIEAPPAALDHREGLRDWHWFTNDSGDFLACHELRGRHACGNVYVLYRRDQDFKEQEILCLT